MRQAINFSRYLCRSIAILAIFIVAFALLALPALALPALASSDTVEAIQPCQSAPANILLLKGEN